MTNLVCERSDYVLRFRRAGGSVLVVQNAEPDARPFIHPIVCPDSSGVLTEDAPSHHPWQHGLYIGLNDVNGVGFWAEGLLKHVKGYENDGTFHPRPLESPTCNANRAKWRVVTDWRDPQGVTMLTETQAWALTDLGERLIVLDLTWTLEARIDLRFGKYAYGGLFLRMPYRKDLDARSQTSEGLVNQTGEGQRARWVALEMPVEGRFDYAGIAILDHPRNPQHPTPWRIDGDFGVGPARCIAGAWSLSAGQSTVERYRLLAFPGHFSPNEIETDWQRYAAASVR